MQDPGIPLYLIPANYGIGVGVGVSLVLALTNKQILSKAAAILPNTSRIGRDSVLTLSAIALV